MNDTVSQKVCSDCGQNHMHQIADYPDGSDVFARIEISQAIAFAPIPMGTKGRVSGHCDDGRACIIFEVPGGSHAFHQPEVFLTTRVAGSVEPVNGTPSREHYAAAQKYLTEHFGTNWKTPQLDALAKRFAEAGK